jgi:hypothetical protein
MKKDMWYIKSFNFTCWAADKIDINEAMRQIDEMVERCSVNTVNFAFGARQEHAYSTEIDWKGAHMLTDSQVSKLVEYSKSKGLKVIIKPMVNTMDGYWRAYIRFFDEDVPCEPKWSEWFKNYTEYIVHYAELCEKYDAEMLIIGCELVGTDHRESEWRELIRKVREKYSGLVTYNCDKYQEHNVKWWDALDVISSSGYYPIADWDNQINRVQAVIDKFDKPFFFSEGGCPSTEGASQVPNDWTVIGKRPVSLEEQAEYFKVMFNKCRKLKGHYGYSIWDWSASSRYRDEDIRLGGYGVQDKPVQQIIKAFYSEN